MGFSALTQLGVLSLYGWVGLASVDAADFASQHVLEYLDLSTNSALTTLPSDVFDAFSDTMTTLHVSWCSGLVSLPDDIFAQLSALQALRMDGITSLRALPSFAGLTALRSLDLHDTGIETIEANAFAPLGNLQTLQLNDNAHLHSIAGGAFNGLATLRHLELHHNPALALLPPDAFAGLSSLETLNLNDDTSLLALPAGLFDPCSP